MPIKGRGSALDMLRRMSERSRSRHDLLPCPATWRQSNDDARSMVVRCGRGDDASTKAADKVTDDADAEPAGRIARVRHPDLR